jgi:hypothetical protein
MQHLSMVKRLTHDRITPPENEPQLPQAAGPTL